MRIVTHIVFALIAAGGAGAAPPAAATAEDGPEAVISRLNDALVETLREAEALGYRGRFERLAPAVDAAFDIPFMAEKSLGRWWRTIDDDARERWIALSRDFSVANYAANFDRDTGQSIELLGTDSAAADTVIVRTRIRDPEDDDVDINYRLHESGGRWRIVDLYLKGTVSELAMRRADYTSVIQRSGFDALVEAIEDRVAEMAAGGRSSPRIRRPVASTPTAGPPASKSAAPGDSE